MGASFVTAKRQNITSLVSDHRNHLNLGGRNLNQSIVHYQLIAYHKHINSYEDEQLCICCVESRTCTEACASYPFMP